MYMNITKYVLPSSCDISYDIYMSGIFHKCLLVTYLSDASIPQAPTGNIIMCAPHQMQANGRNKKIKNVHTLQKYKH